MKRRGVARSHWQLLNRHKPLPLLVGVDRVGFDRGHQFREAPGEVLALTTDQADVIAVLVSEHAVAVYLLLIDPALPVEGPGDLRGVGEG